MKYLKNFIYIVCIIILYAIICVNLYVEGIVENLDKFFDNIHRDLRASLLKKGGEE